MWYRGILLAVVAGLFSQLSGATVSPSRHVVTTSTTSTSTTIPALITDAERTQWEKVAWCETHSDWEREGTWHDGGLGMLQAAWEKFGGLEFAPRPHLATRDEQIVVAIRIQGSTFVPDQQGECSAW